MFAYIPARGGSKRVPRKNIRLLDGKPVLAHVIETLRSLEFIGQVCVSSDDPEIVAIAEAHGAVCLDLRDPELAGDGPGFSDLMRRDIPRFCEANGGDREVLFVLATAALVPPAVYEEAYRTYCERRPEILMACERYAISPFWALVPKEDDHLRPLFPDKVRVNSQDLPDAFTDAGLFYYFDLDKAARYDNHKDMERLLPFLVPERYCADIDRPEDWEVLEFKYARMKQTGREQ